MLHPGFIYSQLTRARLLAGRNIRKTRVRVALETLEGRALLSNVPHHAAVAAFVAHHDAVKSAHAEVRALRIANARAHAHAAAVSDASRPDPHPGPILNEVGKGYAVKSLRIYPGYEGVRRPELNAASARAFLDGRGNLVLTTNLAGAINTTPVTSDLDAYYTWGIDRGTGPIPGYFPGRPSITFDSLVTVAVEQQTGVTGVVTDLATGVSTALPASSIIITGDNIRVILPINNLVSTLPSSIPTVNFFTSDAPPSTDYTTVESFVPEFRNFPIAVRHGISPTGLL